MRFWGQMFLVFCLLYCALSRVAVVHEICDILLRHVFNINFFKLQLHKHPSEDSIAGLRVAVLCAFLTYIYSIYFPPRDSDSDKERPSKITLGYSTILKAIRSLNWMVSLQFNDMNDRLLSLENNSELYWKKYCKSLSKKADLSDARKVASKMPRKHLHVITRNAASRHMRNLKIRLDAAQLEKLQLAFQNNDLSLSVTALDDVVEALFSDITPSSTNRTHLTNIDKIKHVHKSAKTINKQKDARISALKAENNDLSENLCDVKQDLDSARTKAADSADDCQRSEDRLQQVTEAKSGIEESLRKCKNTMRQHQLAFLKNFASAVLKAHPEVEGIAKSVAAAFVPPAPQVDKPVKAPTKAATTASSSVATPCQTSPKALCACEYHFLVTDSQADCKDRLDGCDEFAQATAEEKTRLLGKLGMAADVQKKQTQAKSETIACWNCKRDFPKAVSQWFYGVHTKTCKKNAPSFNDLPGSSPSAAKTPVRQQSQIVQQVPRLATPEKTTIEPPASPAITIPSPHAIVNENNWQKKDASDNRGAPKSKTLHLPGLGGSKYAS